MANVLVICETSDGKLKKASRELLSVGRGIAEKSGGELCAAAFGGSATAHAGEAGLYGAKTLYAVSNEALDDSLTERDVDAIAAVVTTASPDVVLFSASASAKDVAPRLGARLGAGVASEVVGLEWGDGKLVAKRPVYSGKILATVEIESTPAIATCRANAFPPQESGSGAAEVIEVAFTPGEPKTKKLETLIPEGGEIPLTEADTIVAGGRGLKEPENYKLIRDLAHELNGAVGASRATVDAGWIDHQHQVGQTGRVVSPNLYVAIGISGAIQHLAGMTSSKHIVAINKDPEAPIFKVADLGIVGDLFEIVPALTEAVREAKAKG